MKRYQKLASTINACKNCIESNNQEWIEKHNATINEVMDSAPSGSGIDCGTKLNDEKTTDEKLVFIVEYHHMNDNGMYDGWTNHEITVKPSLLFGYRLSISGKDRNNIKEYLGDIYAEWLDEEIS